MSPLRIMYLLMAAAAQAASIEPRTNRCPSIEVHANFENITASAVAGSVLSQLPRPYAGLNYIGMGVINTLQMKEVAGIPVPIELPGIHTHSPPNALVATLASRLLNGTPRLSTNYPNTNTESFRFSSFYYGAVLNLQTGLASYPVTTSIFVKGFRAPTPGDVARQVCVGEYTYAPPDITLGPQEMQLARFDCAVDLDYLEFDFYVPRPLPELTSLAALVMDNFEYEYRPKTC